MTNSALPIHDSYFMPIIKQSLIYSPSLENDSAFYIVKDPETNRYFRLNRQTVSMMKVMDGNHNVQDIRTQLGFDEGKIVNLIHRLAGLQLLQTDSLAVEKNTGHTTKHSWELRKILFLRKDIIYPDQLILKVYRVLKLEWLFRLRFVIFFLLLFLVALITYIRNFSFFTEAFQKMLAVKSIPLAYLALLGISALHELAHGIACKHFGGTIRAIGVGLYYFRPVFYCDVSDAWLFRKKEERIITHSAGVIMNLLIVFSATSTLPLIPPSNWLSQLLVTILLISGFQSLKNLNPLLRLDGYFILADWLGIENMRSKAFALLYSLVKIITNRENRNPPPAISSRESQILLAYAILSIIYIIILFISTGFFLGYLFIGKVGTLIWPLAFILSGLLFIGPIYSTWRNFDEKSKDELATSWIS